MPEEKKWYLTILQNNKLPVNCKNVFFLLCYWLFLSFFSDIISKLFFHMAYLRAQNNAVVRTEDSDILIIGLESMEKLPAEKNILLETVL